MGRGIARRTRQQVVAEPALRFDGLERHQADASGIQKDLAAGAGEEGTCFADVNGHWSFVIGWQHGAACMLSSVYQCLMTNAKKKSGRLPGEAGGPGIQRVGSLAGKLIGSTLRASVADPGQLWVGRTGNLLQPARARSADGGVSPGRWGETRLGELVNPAFASIGPGRRSSIATRVPRPLLSQRNCRNAWNRRGLRCEWPGPPKRGHRNPECKRVRSM